MAEPLFHQDDQRGLRHGRHAQDGFPVGRYLQPAPMLFTRDGHNVFLGDMYRGRTAFLVCSGPSLPTHNLTLLHERGVLTCAVNNAAVVHRPHLWVSADDPGNFCDVIWRDPGILKFVPLCHMEKRFQVRDAAERLVESSEVVGDMPAVFGFRRNERFDAETWLHENSFNWGNHTNTVDADGHKGSRSIMYIALRLLFYLGIRRVYLLGCDFRMEVGKQNYAFEQDRSAASVRGNNSSYQILNQRLRRLLPKFAAEGFEIFNCTPNSGLSVFPYVRYEEAIAAARAAIPSKANTAGMYDRAAQAKEAQKTKSTDSPPRFASPRQVVSRSLVHSRLPDMTLVVGVGADDAEVWRHTWQTWQRYKPWLVRLPLLVIHNPSLERRRAFEFLRQMRNVKFIPYECKPEGDAQGQLSAALVKLPAEFVSTPWYLRLDPGAIATDKQLWIDPGWFSDRQQPPVFVAGPWGYSKPADAIERLDQWADSMPLLATHPRVNLPFDGTAERLKHDAINSWCFVANTEWTRQIAAFTPDILPHPSHATYVHFCALRRCDPYLRVQMKDFGWEHHFGRRQSIIDRCQQLLT